MYRIKRKGSADMAACYKKMVNPKTEAAKLFLFLSLTAFCFSESPATVSRGCSVWQISPFFAWKYS